MKKWFYPLAAVTFAAAVLLVVNLDNGLGDIDQFGTDFFSGLDFLLFFGFLGGEWFLATVSIAAVLYLWFRRNHYLGMLIVLLAVGGGNYLNKLIKTLTERQRPGGLEDGFSFPSGHAMVSMIAAIVIIYLITEKSGDAAGQALMFAVGMLISVLAGLSRMPDEAHYFTDVIGGWLLGYTYAILCLVVYEYLMKRRASV
ncbi:phosphatase PAP2 family protein [Jeotgalibacillus haloalkalitolerans]|uniref:Phosphatase PAP2 family protein n=1 Tax=Jeotgalibacillus haloalkalitolerans TaxID=3104292 RepID=A0ABU5KPJ5_9BACL|nr:phosphatase PAP2 family protein [Jeotgalibacillus sp. HH7-29]MDZ5713069.1 phosphatase PAP2 family protein [Jeotgalibacillus sp. HH7-29]